MLRDGGVFKVYHLRQGLAFEFIDHFLYEVGSLIEIDFLLPFTDHD